MDGTPGAAESYVEDASTRDSCDVVIVGGGAAGLSAAMALGRALRRVVVVDAGQPRNAPASHMHGFLGHDGLSPALLLEKGRAEVASYGVALRQDSAIHIARRDDVESVAFTLTLQSGAKLEARRVLIATGAKDRLPDIPGLAEVWGKDVHVCPYCHGYEVRNAPLAVIATGDHSSMYALMIRNWSSDLFYFDHEHRPLTEEEQGQFDAMGIRRVQGTIRRIVVDDGRLTAIEMEDGARFDRSAVFMGTTLTANASLLQPLGVATHHSGHGTVIEVDQQGKTSVPGIWAAGNVTNPSLQVVGAAAAGAAAAGGINMDLIMEEVNRKVEALDRDQRSAAQS
jgi:thioredoxin reductase